MKTYYFLLFGLLWLCLPFSGNSQDVRGNKKELSIEIQKKDAKSEGSADGFIHLKISGGVSPYKIHCFSPYALPTKTEADELKLSNIKSGDYVFIIQDKTGERITREVKIDDVK